MKIFDKINFKEPKYMLPAILYVLVLAAYIALDSGVRQVGVQVLRHLHRLVRYLRRFSVKQVEDEVRCDQKRNIQE